MGLPSYVSALRERGEQRLFPSFRYEPQNGWGRPLGRWFNDRFLPKLGLKSKTLVFHSLRHTVVTRLLQLDIEQPLVKAIIGHAQEGVTQQSYFKQGYKLQQLSGAIEKLT
jgi:integrase